MNSSQQIQTNDSKYRLSAEEFINIWKGKYLNIPSYNTIFYEEFSIEISNPDNSISYGNKTIIVNFRNIEVDGPVYLNEDIEYLPVNISGVIFNEIFQIYTGTFQNFLVGRNEGNIFKNGIRILGGHFKNNMRLNSISSSNSESNIEIHGGTFETKLRIWGVKNVKLNIINGHFKGGLSLYGIFDEIFIGGGTYSSDLELDRLFCKKKFQIIGGYFSKFISGQNEWTHDEFAKYTTFIDCGIIRRGIIHILGDFVISNVDCKYINLGINYKNVFSFINNLYVIGFNKSLFIQNIYENNLFINKIHIENSTILSGNIFRLDNFNIADLIIENVIAQGNLHFNSLKGCSKYELNYEYFSIGFMHRLHEDSVPNDEKIKILPHKSELRILFSDLGNSNFFNCDFSDFKLFFESSKIENLYLVGSSLPKVVYNNGDNRVHQIKIAYSQLRKVFEKNDIHTSNEYLINEIETYRHLLKNNKKNISDRIVLLLNKITSNHGNDWSLTLICIIIFNILSFSILLRSLGFIFDLSIDSIENYFKLLSYFFTYLNPIHRSDFLSSCSFKMDSWNTKSEFVDSVSKIINAYLIYQFIQAFRKFGKK